MRAALAPFVDHALLLGRDEIQQGIAGDAHQAARCQQRCDLLAGAAAEKGQLVADRRVLRAGASAAGWRWYSASVELPDDDHRPSARTEQCTRVGERDTRRW